MAEPLSGQVTAFFLFDVAEGVDLSAVRGLLGASTESPRLAVKPAVPAYVQYQDPPVQVDAEAFGTRAPGGMQARFKIYDYGVFSLSLSRAFRGSWADLHALAQSTTSAALEADAEALCLKAAERLRPALHEPRRTYLSEDYFVYAVTAADGAPTGDALVAAHGDDIARLLRGEADALSTQERDEVLRHRLSYLASDLVVPSWNGAFVYDSEAGVPGALEILEFANSQLLQFRYYDQPLDRELTRIYARLQTTDGTSRGSAGATRAARELHALFIDVNELTDRTENALKLVGDVYAARLLGLAAAQARPGRVEGRRAGQAEDARRHLPLRRRSDRHGPRRDPRGGHRLHPRPGAGAVLHGHHELIRDESL